MKTATAQQIHTIDWRAEAWLSGTSQLGPNEGWLYVTIINLIYAHGEAIDCDLKWIGRQANMHGRSVKAALSKLIEMGKVWHETDGKLMAKRCETELETARKRISKWIEKGGNLGRPPKDNSHLQEAPHTDSLARTRGTTNHQPPTTRKKSPANAEHKEADPRQDARWPADREVPIEWIAETYHESPCKDGFREADAFRDYWSAGKGAKTKRTESGWKRTWLNWMERCREGPDTTWSERYGFQPLMHGKPEETDDDWRRRYGYLKRLNEWSEINWGPRPGAPGCRMPARLILECENAANEGQAA